MACKMGASETTPLPLAVSSRPVLTSNAEAARIASLGLIMISCSVAVINFNKYMVGGVFPFPSHLVLFHTGFGSVLAFVLYFLRPSLFPSLTDPDAKVSLDYGLIFGKIIPISLVFACNLVLSNMAYMHSSLAFLQMMKEGNVVLVYVASLCVGIEVYKSRSCVLLTFIMLATMMNIEGELNFSMVGCIIQVASQLFEVIRLVLQAIVLSDKGQKLDSLTYVLVVMPPCFLILATLLLVRFFVDVGGSADFAQPAWSDLWGCWHLLVMNATVAFCLNVSIALFMKHTSAVAMVLAGLIKDSLVVVTSVLLLGEVMSRTQQVGFSLQLLGVFVWSLMKRFPSTFDRHGLVGGVSAVLLGEKECST